MFEIEKEALKKEEANPEIKQKIRKIQILDSSISKLKFFSFPWGFLTRKHYYTIT